MLIAKYLVIQVNTTQPIFEFRLSLQSKLKVIQRNSKAKYERERRLVSICIFYCWSMSYL